MHHRESIATSTSKNQNQGRQTCKEQGKPATLNKSRKGPRGHQVQVTSNNMLFICACFLVNDGRVEHPRLADIFGVNSWNLG